MCRRLSAALPRPRRRREVVVGVQEAGRSPQRRPRPIPADRRGDRCLDAPQRAPRHGPGQPTLAARPRAAHGVRPG
eukprot:368993-Alexandrium_andersonii.AAC.1